MRRLILLVTLAASAPARSQATPADQQWLAEMRKLTDNPSPEAARQRATLAYWSLTSYAGRAERLGLDPGYVRSQGMRDALAAAQGLPDSPGIWKELSAWRALGPFDAVAASKVACPAAEHEPGKVDVGELCGDFLQGGGDIRGAIHSWRRALDTSIGREDRLRLIEKIEGASANPDKDLAGIPAGLRQQAHLQEERNLQEQQAQRQAQAQAAQQGSQAVQGCYNACAVDASQCHYAQGYSIFDLCDNRQRHCNATCVETNGAMAPSVYPPPVYFGPQINVAPQLFMPGY